MEAVFIKRNKTLIEETGSTSTHRLLTDRVFATLAHRTISYRYFPEIDDPRSVAILLIVFYHVQRFIDGQQVYLHPFISTKDFFRLLSKHNFFVVQVFFTISGFSIALLFTDYFGIGVRLVRLKVFYFRRITRLKSPYIINIPANCMTKAVTDHTSLIIIAEQFFFFCLHYIHW
jgi:peptidoglycan/LPS O-acetylase OafA/YrhL